MNTSSGLEDLKPSSGILRMMKIMMYKQLLLVYLLTFRNPKKKLTIQLIDFGGLNAIIRIRITGTIDVTENTLIALYRLTNPTDIETQRFD